MSGEREILSLYIYHDAQNLFHEIMGIPVGFGPYWYGGVTGNRGIIQLGYSPLTGPQLNQFFEDLAPYTGETLEGGIHVTLDRESSDDWSNASVNVVPQPGWNGTPAVLSANIVDNEVVIEVVEMGSGYEDGTYLEITGDGADPGMWDVHFVYKKPIIDVSHTIAALECDPEIAEAKGYVVLIEYPSGPEIDPL